MRTFIATTSEGLEARKWWVVDAQGQPLGRLASRIANILRGKHKPTFTPHIDCGDFVIVVNAANVKMTGQKADRKLYYRHSGFPGGLRTESFRHLIERNPPAPIELAVKGMLPRSKLGRQLLRKLKVYATAQHPHAAQQPQTLSW